MPSLEDITPVVAMVAGFLIQNGAEWRAGGPRPPDGKLVCRIFPAVSDRTRLLALIFVSASVVFLCIVSLVFDAAWGVVAIAAALALNAVAQLAASLRVQTMQPGTLAGLIFMLPPSLWVIVAFGGGWIPLVIGPLLSLPLLAGVWWLADLFRGDT